MTTIYFVRHGQASFGAESYDKLSAVGENQAELLGQYFKTLFPEPPVIISGAMQRHQQTANISLHQFMLNHNFDIDACWNEFDHHQVFAKFDPRFDQPALLKQEILSTSDPRAYLETIFEGAIERWVSGQYDDDYDETYVEFAKRIEQGLVRLKQQAQAQNIRNVVVYTSGGVISVIVGKVLGLDIKSTFELNWSVVNASFTTIKLTKEKTQLLSFNEHHYIKSHDPKLLTWL